MKNKVLTILLTLAFLAPSPLYASPPEPLEQQVKSAFVYRLIRYVEWKSSTATPITIGVFGEGSITPYLQKIEGKRINGQQIKVKTTSNIEDLKSVQVLFITRMKKERAKEILNNLKGENILTISDMDGFCDLGGNIGLITTDGKVHLQVNLKTSREAGLRISSKILRFAELIFE
jgi:hypothetical protein